METVWESRLGATTELEQAYQAAVDRWIGCDWPTRFGNTGLNLQGLTARQAILMARATSGQESADWRQASEWLNQVEFDANIAQYLAARALAFVTEGKPIGAVVCAERACAIEDKYSNQHVWRPLYEAVRALAAAPVTGSGTCQSVNE